MSHVIALPRVNSSTIGKYRLGHSLWLSLGRCDHSRSADGCAPAYGSEVRSCGPHLFEGLRLCTSTGFALRVFNGQIGKIASHPSLRSGWGTLVCASPKNGLRAWGHPPAVFCCHVRMQVRSLSIMPERNSNVSGGVGCLFLLVVFGFMCYGGYNELDDKGWIQHTNNVDLYMKGEWLQGENRMCTGFQSFPSGKNEPPRLTSLSCPETYALDEIPHNMTIKFWGKVSRPDMTKAGLWLSWQCTRNSDGFVCRALN